MDKLFSTEFYEMGGWAAYVWPAYGVAALALGAIAWRIVRRNAETRRQLERAEARRRRLRAADAEEKGEAG